MPVGPRGEKRPTSSVSSMVKAMRVATGIEEEEYVDGKPRERTSPAKSSDDEDESDEEYELAALEIPKPKKRKRKKREPKT